MVCNTCRRISKCMEGVPSPPIAPELVDEEMSAGIKPRRMPVGPAWLGLGLVLPVVFLSVVRRGVSGAHVMLCCVVQQLGSAPGQGHGV